ncbi:hypothetical protein RvY_18810-2 [Ramazzottius varieornatus]|uniref:Uncharacterized protein n=1 Tax=Ramazzottius varieornatus TaxID=947166 RepID=A0A1D1W7D4_RAMVA|nr:hypothetical protein RvY_18810-2 [Ramazzottius varieornatus]
MVVYCVRRRQAEEGARKNSHGLGLVVKTCRVGNRRRRSRLSSRTDAAVGAGEAAERFPDVVQQAQRALLRQLRPRFYHSSSAGRGRYLLVELCGKVPKA